MASALVVAVACAPVSGPEHSVVPTRLSWSVALDVPRTASERDLFARPDAFVLVGVAEWATAPRGTVRTSADGSTWQLAANLDGLELVGGYELEGSLHLVGLCHSNNCGSAGWGVWREAGDDWRRVADVPTKDSVRVFRGPELIVLAAETMVGTSSIWVSKDGITLRRAQIPPGVGLTWIGFGSIGDEIVGVGYADPLADSTRGDRGITIWASRDSGGSFAERRPRLDGAVPLALSSTGDGLQLLVTRPASDGGSAILRTDDGHEWEAATPPHAFAPGRPDALASAAGVHIALGMPGAWSSADGRSWVAVDPIPSPVEFLAERVVLRGNRVVALGLELGDNQNDFGSAVWVGELQNKQE